MNEFLSMGGYAAYVWSAYGITLGVLVWNAWAATRRHKKMLEEVKRMIHEQADRKSPVVRRNP
jgi:heme exporter protein D